MWLLEMEPGFSRRVANALSHLARAQMPTGVSVFHSTDTVRADSRKVSSTQSSHLGWRQATVVTQLPGDGLLSPQGPESSLPEEMIF